MSAVTARPAVSTTVPSPAVVRAAELAERRLDAVRAYRSQTLLRH